MQDLNDLYYFVQVVDHGGFAAAGRAPLGMPKSRLSRRIIALEERLGVRLLQRSTRRFAVTEIGQEYYRHCVAMLVEAERRRGGDRAHRARSRRARPGQLRRRRWSASSSAPMIARFMAANPRVRCISKAPTAAST